ncbi:POK19 protein, partial [Thinocorus orbignyianus]|nr:POK19 protein [Thinocorus orbignyianus]
IIAEGNAIIDTAVSQQPPIVAVAGLSPFGLAQQSHAFFHQSAMSLHKEFNVPLSEARSIIAACPDCAHLAPLQTMGTNPRGLRSQHLYQTDVTVYSPFGCFKNIHVTIDTFSKLTWATVA